MIKKTKAATYIALTAINCILSTATFGLSATEQAEQGVVRVLNLDQQADGLYFNGFGSGVVIDSKGWILTNAHVLRGHDKIHVQWKTETGKVQSEEAEVIKQDQQKDLALLRVPGLSIRPIAIASQLPAKGTAVYAIGFPGVADTGATADDVNEGFVEATVTQGVVGRVLTRDTSKDNKWSMVQHSAVISEGSSGGALVNQCGYLVGINTSGALADTKKGDQVVASGFSFAIQAPQAYIFALENGAKPLNKEGSCDPVNTSKQSVAESSVGGWQASPSILAFALGAIIVFGAAVAGLLSGRQRRSVSGQAPVERRSNQWELVGFTTSNDSVRIIVIEHLHTESNPLVVGRDISCGAVISDPTVSRRHAKLFVAQGELWCSDLGSSNGTKVNDQSCGQSPIPLTRSGVVTLGTLALQVRVGPARKRQ